LPEGKDWEYELKLDGYRAQFKMMHHLLATRATTAHSQLLRAG
jgi:ATP-dependent DNA ligase